MQQTILSREFRLNHLYRVINKEGKNVVFSMNKAQKYLFDMEKKYSRIIILKARQLGVTTYKVIDGLDNALFYSNQNRIITAHKQEKQYEIFEKVKFAYEQLPNEIRLQNGKVWIKPKTKYETKSMLHFDNESKIRITLDSRSGTSTSTHISEIAFIRDAGAMMAGTMESIPKHAPVTIETTANGINYFYELRQKHNGKEPMTELDFKTVFIPRYTDPEYCLDVREQFELPPELKHLEGKLPGLDNDTIELTQEQKYWYFKKRSNTTPHDLVFQENPTLPDEAFITSGRPFFDINTIKNIGALTQYDKDELYPDLRIYNRSYERPIRGVDTAEGGEGGDYSSISIRERGSMDLLAHYYGRIPADGLGELVDYIYNKYYQKGMIGIESNNTGLATILHIKNAGYECNNYLYKREVFDEKTKRKNKKVGWNTNSSTRPVMLANYESLIRTGEVNQFDDRMVQEFYGFVYDDNNKAKANEGGHDDAIMSDSLCLMMRNSTQPYTELKNNVYVVDESDLW